ncbi:MAG: hypothetical protein WCO84_03200 [bacterium]
MKGVIKAMVNGQCELFVQPDNGGDPVIVRWDVTIEEEDDSEVDFIFDSETTDPEIKKNILFPPDDCVICFKEDRIRYEKTNTGEYALTRLLVKEGDPRSGLDKVETEP